MTESEDWKKKAKTSEQIADDMEFAEQYDDVKNWNKKWVLLLDVEALLKAKDETIDGLRYDWGQDILELHEVKGKIEATNKILSEILLACPQEFGLLVNLLGQLTAVLNPVSEAQATKQEERIEGTSVDSAEAFYRAKQEKETKK